jgi:DNA polymerase I
MRHYGLSVNFAKWNSTMDKIKGNIERLSSELHELFDVPILEDRRIKFEAKMEPYRGWVAQRDTVVEMARKEWNGADNMEEVEVPQTQLIMLFGVDEEDEALTVEVPGKPIKIKRQKKGKPGWGERKKEVLAAFEATNPKPPMPSALKDGVNLQSWQQILVGIRSFGYNIADVKEETLKPLAGDWRVAKYLEFVGFSTIKKRYNDTFLSEYAPLGKFFAHWLQIGASTGRFACYAPNVQQVPDHGVGGELRQAIVPSFGFLFVDADLSNIELRIAAELSGDTVLLNAFAGGIDLHSYTAEFMFSLRDRDDYMRAIDSGVTPKAWTDSHDAVVGGRAIEGHTYRDIAKTINYMVLFGGGANKLSSMLRIPLQDAKLLMRAHRDTYKIVMAWIAEQGERLTNYEARKTGRAYAVTRSGRRRWFDVPTMGDLPKTVTPEQAKEAQQKWTGQMAAVRRQLANHPIQGLAADIAKLVMALWHENFNSDDMHLVAVVHDEFIVEARDNPEVLARAQLALDACMQQALHTYLTNVNVGETHPTIVDWWKH